MSQIRSDFASIQVLATQVSDSWFNGVIIESLTHGMYTTLLAVVLWRMLSSCTPHRGQTKLLAGISIFMYIMATIHFTVRWFYARRAFIANGETEETRFFALTDSLIAGGPLWTYGAKVMFELDLEVLDHMGKKLEDRRPSFAVHAMRNESWFPVFDVFFLIQELTPLADSQGKPMTPWGSEAINWGVAYYSMTLSTTVICTALIVFRLARASATGQYLRFAPNPYHQVMEIIVESAALYVVALAVYIPFIATNSPYSNYLQVILASVTGIAPILILLRVVSRSPDLRSRCDKGSVTSAEKDDVTLIIPAKSVEAV
ncbi:hypothetical protein DFS33DRAFT_1401254 [Desarmillaria ectypa]|nr:hypothetical protein DFS33DRAFT_1401254 [Desarmillaria ectypa]